ncbi:PREDICTED: ankyrin repeat domain-containing protein 26-like [Ficedula albicollis]|uniref:ankyrin repeat domain-containing protein 26-like n=1 Tax=Ficedula albicollis TaxID=59894 RepID=UPI0007AD9657|nr:PREDICTED: ankyrin repeat domain-containing protein 26-like [Ficedula albicollis]
MVLPDLHSAAASADLARLRQRWWLNKLRINAYNRDKQTPLHLACINGHADVVQFLVEKKCKLNPRDKLNKSPLMKAVEHQHRDCAAILLEHGANPNHKGASGNTALHLAVMVSSKSLVDLLLEHGADIEAKNKLGYTPLALAITENCEEMAKFLLQKGADVNAQDNVFRTPLTIATVSGNKKAKELLLQHGAVFSESDKGLCQTFTKVVQDDVIANEQIGSSCYETTPVIPLETSSLAESDDGSKEEAAEKEDQNKVYAHIITAQTYRDYKAEGPEKKKDKCRLWNPEPNSEVLDKAAVPVLLPPGMFPEPSVAKGSIKGTWKAAGAAKEEDNGSLCNPKHLGGLIDKVINPVQRPAGKRSRVGERSAAKEHGKGVLQPAGGAAEKEDTDSSLDSETDPKSQGRVWTSVWLPAAKGNRLDARSAKVECGKGVSSAASVEAEKEDGDLSWGSEAFSDIVKKVLGGKRRPAAKRKPVGVRSTAVECGKGVLKQACREGMKQDGVLQPAGGEAKDEDNDSPWDSETDSEGEGKMSAAVQLPTANSNRLDAGSAAVECGKGVLKQAYREGMKEDGVMQSAGGTAKDEDNDSPWDPETDSEGKGKASANVQLPAAPQNRVGVSSAAVEHIKAARVEQKEHFISSSENKLPALHGDDLRLKVDSSTQTASEQYKQLPALHEDDLRLKVDSSTQTASEQDKQLPALHGDDLQLKVDSSTQTASEQYKQLKYLKEPFHKNDYYAESVKNVLKEKKVLTVLRNLQSCLADCLDSSAAAIPQLEERIRRLQIQRARLEATIQQQAKTIEALEKIQQVSYRSKLLRAFPVRDPQSLVHDSSVDTGLRHCDFPHTIKNCFGEKFAK